MRVNRPAKPARSIRYLLCADRKLQKLSLRRISAPAKKARKASTSKSVSRSVPSLTPRAVFAGAICVMAAAVLIAARQPSPQTDVPSISAAPTAIPQPGDVKLPNPIGPQTRKILPPKPATAGVPRPAATDPSIEKVTSGDSANTVAAEPSPSTPKAVAPTTNVAAVESAANVAGHGVAAVTITGCLSNDEQTFWLKDTSGADAPKSRNWRSGFLRKRAAPVELLDATHALKLRNYVGQRVSATGTLVNREMRAQSLQRVASTCS